PAVAERAVPRVRVGLGRTLIAVNPLALAPVVLFGVPVLAVSLVGVGRGVSLLITGFLITRFLVARLLVTRFLVARLLVTRFLVARLLVTRFLVARLLVTRLLVARVLVALLLVG